MWTKFSVRERIHIIIVEFNYRAWHFITSFIDYAIQIYVGQKAGENQWRVMVLEEFLHIALLYQATNTRNINVVAVLKGPLKWTKFFSWISVFCHTMHKSTLFIIQLCFVYEL